MNQVFLNKVQQMLQQKKEAILSQLAGSHETVSSGQVKDIGDEALSASMDTLQSSLEQHEIDEVNMINAALARISRGDYGICVDCGNFISEKRLEHSPYVARCIVCQEELENEQSV